MLFSDLFKESILAIFANKLRSALTILGIVIGIGSVIAMISVGQGASDIIQSNIQAMGSNLITIRPGFQRTFSQVASSRGTAQSLTLEDAQALVKEIPIIKKVAPELWGRYQVVVKGKNVNVQVVGTNPSYLNVRNIAIDLGSFISEQNLNSLAKVAVLGPTVRNDLFGEGVNPVGETIRINGINFKVIGVTKTKGGTGFGSQDEMIFVPISTAQKFLIGKNYILTINAQVESSELMEQAKIQITDLLLRRHNIFNPENADFSVMSQEDILSTATNITNTMTILLAAIAGISLIVGGIGIMNMMFTSVTERTKEIGLRKAVGAKNIDIALQFLSESIILTLIGGFFGIILGWGGSLCISYFGQITTKVTFFLIILAFSVAAIIGIIFGYWPAKRAAKLNPIEALRYE